MIITLKRIFHLSTLTIQYLLKVKAKKELVKTFKTMLGKTKNHKFTTYSKGSY